MLGDKESGKTTLVAKLQGNEDPKKGAGLEYGYIDVRDEYRDGNFSPESYYFDGGGLRLLFLINKLRLKRVHNMYTPILNVPHYRIIVYLKFGLIFAAQFIRHILTS